MCGGGSGTNRSDTCVCVEGDQAPIDQILVYVWRGSGTNRADTCVCVCVCEGGYVYSRYVCVWMLLIDPCIYIHTP